LSARHQVARHQVARLFGAVLAARLNVSLPGLERQVAQDLVDATHQAYPYSNDTRSNIDAINLF
jgi:organic hydroperoxide reductase OsmC/OhrA